MVQTSSLIALNLGCILRPLAAKIYDFPFPKLVVSMLVGDFGAPISPNIEVYLYTAKNKPKTGIFSFPEIPEKFPTPEISYPIPENFISSKTRHTRTRLFQLREFPYPPEFDFFRTRHITNKNLTFIFKNTDAPKNSVIYTY